MKTIKTIPLTSFAQERERERERERESARCAERRASAKVSLHLLSNRSPKGGQWLTNRNDQLLIDYCRQGGES